MAYDATLPANNPWRARKAALLLVLVGALVGNCGCMTYSTLHAAKEESHKTEEGKVVVDKKWEPGYYAFLPLTVAGDIATSPFQLAAFLMLLGFHDC